MSLFVLAEPPLIEAFSLIGVPGQTPEPDRDLEGLIGTLAEKEGVRLVLAQHPFAARLNDDQLDRLARKCSCIVVEIPGLNEPPPDVAPFRQRVQRSIGVVS